MREIGHFIGGKTVAGQFRLNGGDVFDPNTCAGRQAKVAFEQSLETGKYVIVNAESAQPAGLGLSDESPQRRAARSNSSSRAKGVRQPCPGPALQHEDLRRFPRATSNAGSRWSSSPAGSRPAQRRVQAQRRPRHDLFSLRQPLGVVGIAPSTCPVIIDVEVRLRLPGGINVRPDLKLFRARPFRADAAGRRRSLVRALARPPACSTSSTARKRCSTRCSPICASA